MTAALVQWATVELSGGGTSTVTLAAPPTAGNLLVAVMSERHTAGLSRSTPAGWTKIADVTYGANNDLTTMWYVFAVPGQSSSVSVTGPSNGRRFTVAEYSGVDTFDGFTSLSNQTAASSYPVGPVTLDDAGVMVGAVVTTDPGGGLQNTITNDAAYALVATGLTNGNSPTNIVAHRIAAAGAYSFTPTGNRTVKWGGILAAFSQNVVIPLTAEFSADATGGTAPLTVTFTDESFGGGTILTWAWTFGDGGTSTSQDPSHAYTAPGIYAVSLTVTDATGSDTETKTSYITVTVDVGYVAPPPGGAILEIYAADPGGPRWDVALWDEAVWSTAGWQDVTPQGIEVDITWGSNHPEDGILHRPAAASWAVDYHDPDRILDPANTDGPYYGDLIPGLPLRLSHRGVVVRVGLATGIGTTYDAEGNHRGYMRGADVITVLANADVPDDTDLADTLYARAVDAISAAGLGASIPVGAPVGTDPPVSPWITGTREWTVWEWVLDAAQEVLQVPYIDRYGTLRFRPWDTPLVRGRSLDSTELLGLQVITDYSGLYSVITARIDATTIETRALTPAPRYGRKTYARDEITIAPGDWAEAVLADRALPSNRWTPGSVYPLTADSTEALATIEAIERVSVGYPEGDPAVHITGIVVGADINVRGFLPDHARWRFTFYLAQTADEPLIETGGGPTDYLLATGGGEFVYPTT